MRDLLDRLQQELERAEVADVASSADEVRAEIAALEQRLALLTGSVPLWARAAIIIDTEDEVAARQARERLAATRTRLAALGADLDARMERVADHLPAFGVALDVERAVRAVHEVLVDDERGLRPSPGDRAAACAALDALAARVLQTWVPDLDLDALAALSLDPDLAREAARAPAPELELDPFTWWRPISHDELAAAVAGRLLGSGYFERVAALADLEDDARRYQRELLHHDAAACIGAFPPLAVAHAARELRGAVDALSSRPTPRLAHSGAVVRFSAITHSATLLASIEALEGALARAFPGMPAPPSRAGRDPGALLGGAHDAWLEPFYSDIDASYAPTALAASIAHASMASVVRMDKQRNAANISTVDRVVFWSDTPAEAREVDLSNRYSWHIGMLRRCSDQLETIIAHEAFAHPYLGVRAGLVALYSAVDAIHTDRYAKGGRRDRRCDVYGVPEARAALEHVRAHLTRHFGAVGAREELVRDVERALSSGRRLGAPSGSFAALSRAQVVEALAAHLAPAGFLEDRQALARLEASLASQAQRASLLESRISTWDTVNVFSKTEDEQALERLRVDMRETRARVAAYAGLDALFDEALLRVYPPASLAYALPAVSHAIHDIRAVCRTSNDSDGPTRYYCDLVGFDVARDLTRALNRRFLHAWGVIPGHHALVMRWATRAGAAR